MFKFLLAQRDEFWKTLQAVVDDEDYLELARTNFDPKVERAAVRLAGLAAAGFTVEERGPSGAHAATSPSRSYSLARTMRTRTHAPASGAGAPSAART